MTGYPERYIVFDTESYSAKIPAEVPTDELTLRLGAAQVVDRRAPRGSRDWWFEFRTHVEFHDMLAQLFFTTTPIVVLAHNIGFDVRQVHWMWWVGQGRYSLTPPHHLKGLTAYKKPLFIADSPPFIVRLFRPDGQQFLLIDTLQWFDAGLEEVGKWLGEEKGKMPKQDAPDDVWMAYCRRDVEVLHAALQLLWSFLRERRLPDWHFTPAAQAMAIYRMRYEKKRITRTDDVALLELDRHAYYGGLTEAFQIGEVVGPLYQVDVTSLYPYVMQQQGYPARIIDHGDYSAEPRIPDAFDPFHSTAEVWIDSPDHPFPVRGSDQTIWATGKIRTILCRPELERAWSLGIVHRVGRWVRYALDDLFTDFVDEYWGLRGEAMRMGRNLEAKLSKNLMNKLHGKFGQRTGDWVPTGIKAQRCRFGSGIETTMEPGEIAFWRVISGEEYRKVPDQEDPRGFVPIAAWTASYGRCFMWDMIHLAGLEHVYHVSTDSLIVDGVGLGALQVADMVDDCALGRFRVESTAERCTIHAANCVDWDGHKKRPGVKRGSTEVAPDVWSVPKWSGFMEDTAHRQFGAVTIQSLLYDMSRRYERREQAADGSTRPWTVDNWHLSPAEQSRVPVQRRRLGEVT